MTVTNAEATTIAMSGQVQAKLFAKDINVGRHD
jgi:hypothetical protein